jgi:hypothetical protein
MRNSACLLIAASLSLAPVPARAFSNMVCASPDGRIKGAFFSDAPIGTVFRASIEHDGVAVRYVEAQPREVAQGPVILRFADGHALIIDRPYERAVAFDAQGLLLGVMDCDFAH